MYINIKLYALWYPILTVGSGSSGVTRAARRPWRERWLWEVRSTRKFFESVVKIFTLAERPVLLLFEIHWESLVFLVIIVVVYFELFVFCLKGTDGMKGDKGEPVCLTLPPPLRGGDDHCFCVLIIILRQSTFHIFTTPLSSCDFMISVLIWY